MKNIKSAIKTEPLTPNSLWASLSRAKLKEMEEKDILTEQARIKDFNFYISPGYNYSPTIEDFMEELSVRKRILNANEYLLFLRETKKIYSNAKFYYQRWGGRGAGYDRYELYYQIISIINMEIGNNLNRYSFQTENRRSAQSEKRILNSTNNRYMKYVQSFNHFTKNEDLTYKEAELKTCEKHGISLKTLTRAIKTI